jgi:hypothetical protein
MVTPAIPWAVTAQAVGDGAGGDAAGEGAELARSRRRCGRLDILIAVYDGADDGLAQYVSGHGRRRCPVALGQLAQFGGDIVAERYPQHGHTSVVLLLRIPSAVLAQVNLENRLLCIT